MAATLQGPIVRRVMVATDRSESADRAVRWAANLAAAYQAELLLLQVVGPSPEDAIDTQASATTPERAPRWLPAALGGLGSLLAAGLLMDRKSGR